jgi:hypothetical protein
MGKWSAPTYERRRLAKLELQLAPESHTLTVETQSIETYFLTRRKKNSRLQKETAAAFVKYNSLNKRISSLSVTHCLSLPSYTSSLSFLLRLFYPSVCISMVLLPSLSLLWLFYFLYM